MKLTKGNFHNWGAMLKLSLVGFLVCLNVYSGQAGIVLQESINVKGKVADANSNEPLPGVTVLVVGTTNGTVTDLNGDFSIEVPAGGAILKISYVGYLTQEITVDKETMLQVNLVPDVIGLDEVVVTGYSIQKKSDVTGSIATVSSEKLNKIPVNHVDQALQGQAAGVNVVSRSGLPGESSSIQIRGVTSINGGQPLVVIDGVPGSLNGLNASDIESFQILKDASSASIYGVSGGNGVIVITTKKGQVSKIKTNFNFYTGTENVSKKLDMMNSQQFMSWFEERTWEGSSARRRDTIANSGVWDTIPTYDWQDILFESANTQNYDLSFSGGNEVSTFTVSASYNKQDGIIRNSDYERFTFRISSGHKLAKRIKFNQNTYFVNSNLNGFANWSWYNYYNTPIRPSLLMPPMVPDYEPEGSNDEQYPYFWGHSEEFGGDSWLSRLDMINRKEKSNNFSTNASIDVDLFKGLTFTSRFNGSLGFGDTKEFQDVYFNTTTDKRDDKTRLLASMNRSLGYMAQQILNYRVTLFNDHNVAILAGMEYFRDWGFDMSGQRDSLPSSIPAMQYFRTGYDRVSPSQIITGGGWERRKLSYFGQINYDYKGKYLLQASLRRDGVSNLAQNTRFGVFPAASIGWKFTEEEFMQNQEILSFGKIRAGYGEMGSFPRTDYPYLSLIETVNTLGYSYANSSTSSIGAGPAQIENPDVKWETVKMSNIGIELYFLQNSLSLTAEYYNKVNDGMINRQRVPYIAGSFAVDNPEVNFGGIKNTGFEFTLGYKKSRGDWKGSFDLNFTTINNKVVDLATDSLREGAIHNITPISLTRVGGSISEFWGWETDGMFTTDDPFIMDGNNKIYTNQPSYVNTAGETVYAQPTARAGDAKFKDVNGDGRVLTDADKVSLGSPLPKFVFGFSFNIEYKNIDLSAFFNGTYGNKIFNGLKQYLYYYQGYTNHSADFANRYVENDIYKYDPVTNERFLAVPANHNTTVFRDAANNYARPSDFYIEDGSYLRCKSIDLGYTIPNILTSKINVERLRVYVGVKNLFTLTNYQGYNPEVGYTSTPAGSNNPQNLDMGIDIGFYPVTRMYLIGANLSF